MTHVVEPAAERPDQRHPVHRPPSTEPVSAQREVTEATARSAPPMSAHSALLLQRHAGNRATARLIAQRRKTTAPSQAPKPQQTASPTTQRSPALAPVPPSPDGGAVAQRLVAGRTGPGQDPKFAALKQDVQGKQKDLAAHPPAQAEAKAAQGAAKPPPDDKEAQGKTANAEKMNAAKPGEFDKAAFIKAVNDAIAKQAPKNLDEADKFGDSGKANAVKGEVQGKVNAGKEGSAKAIETTTKAPPDTAAAKDKPVTPLQPDKPPPTPGAPNPDQAVPDKAPPAATDFSDGPKQVDKQMADAQVTDDQLAKSNEPEFTGALKDKKAGEAHAATAPGQVRAAEANTLSGAKAAAAQAGATAMTTMTADRVKAGQQVSAGKEGAKGFDESKRAQVTAKLQKVFDTTKKDVEDILNGLDKKVDDQFTREEKAARDAFTADYTSKIDKYKDERYSGLNFWKWGKDKLFGLPDEVNAFYDQARQGYVNRMQQVISNVADTIGAELGRAKQRIATGRAELQAEVMKLPADLQAIGKQAAGEFEGKFDELTQSVNDKGTQLVDTLASKYTEALKAVDDQIAAEKEKNKGLVAKAVDAVKGVIDTILKLKDLLLGVLAKAAQAVSAIIKDPIGFLGHLVSSVGAGLRQFMANIATHLQKGLVSWLLGAAAAAGLQLPAKFDLKGIILLIGSLLGLTWAAIRGRIVQRGVPEQAMSAVESSVPVAKKIQSEGIGGVWEEIKDKVGDLKQNLLGKITEYLIPTVIVAGITWLISLLTPASAFIKACKAIIDIVTFIIDRGAQIIAFVNAVLDAIIAIAAGGAGGVPALIETALATAIPVLIGFLAALLGIGGLADKVKKFFQALSKPVMKAVDWVVDKIVTFGKKIWAKLKGKGKGKDKDAKDGKPGETGDRADVETPKRLVEPAAFHLKESSPGLSAELAKASSGQVIHQTGGDPKQITKSVLAQHSDARYDKASGTLTLPNANVGAPDSLSALGAKVAADTGVSKVSIKKSDQVVEVWGGINPQTPVGAVAAPLTEQEAVRAAIDKVTVVPFLEAMAASEEVNVTKNGVEGTIDLAGFEKAWKDKKLALHVKDKFRAVLDGHHEWIPSDFILEVVLKQRAANLAENGEKWIDLQHRMRSNTFQVVFSPAMVSPVKVKDQLPGETEKRDFSVPNGHVGAVYYPTVSKANQRTTGSKAFHDALRDAFKSGTSPQSAAQAAHAVAKRWMWDSTPMAPDIHPACKDKDGNQVTSTGHAARYAGIEALFQLFV